MNDVDKSIEPNTATATATENNHEDALKSQDRSEEAETIQYSVFSPAQKACISYAASFSAMFSGLSSFTYYPAITALSRSLHVSVELINLTITSYQIVSGIAPSVLSDIADQSGRRPVSLLAFTLYFVANLGLALQNSYTALVVLRCLQSAGASGGCPSPPPPLSLSFSPIRFASVERNTGS